MTLNRHWKGVCDAIAAVADVYARRRLVAHREDDLRQVARPRNARGVLQDGQFRFRAFSRAPTRILHYATSVKDQGRTGSGEDSYRLREKSKTGLLGGKPKPVGHLAEVGAEA